VHTSQSRTPLAPAQGRPGAPTGAAAFSSSSRVGGRRSGR
jgi:hypothetical protein